MTQRAAGRKRSLVALTALAILVLAVLAPVASASSSQIPLVSDPVGTVTDTVGTVTGGGSGGGSTDSGGSGGGGVVGGVTDVVKDTVSPVTGGGSTDSGGSGGGGLVGGVVDKTVGTVEKTVGTVEKTVGTVTDTTKKLLDQTTKKVDNTTSDAGTTVNTIVNGLGNAVDSVGKTVTDPVLNGKGARAGNKDGDKDARSGAGFRGDRKTAPASQVMGAGARAKAARDHAKVLATGAFERARATVASVPAEMPQRETFVSQLAQAAKDAARKLAFPLALALMVGAFLALQSRIDRKDAKLVLAPIDSEQDRLSFR